jgi:hypothetical protein
MPESSSRSHNLSGPNSFPGNEFDNILEEKWQYSAFSSNLCPDQSLDQRYVPKTPIICKTTLCARVKEEMRNPFRRKSKKAEPEPAKQA